MNDTFSWLTDPKTIATLVMALSSVGVLIWHGRQTASVVEELSEWRLSVLPKLASIETELGHLKSEVQRLRDRVN